MGPSTTLVSPSLSDNDLGRLLTSVNDRIDSLRTVATKPTDRWRTYPYDNKRLPRHVPPPCGTWKQTKPELFAYTDYSDPRDWYPSNEEEIEAVWYALTPTILSYKRITGVQVQKHDVRSLTLGYNAAWHQLLRDLTDWIAFNHGSGFEARTKSFHVKQLVEVPIADGHGYAEYHEQTTIEVLDTNPARLKFYDDSGNIRPQILRNLYKLQRWYGGIRDYQKSPNWPFRDAEARARVRNLEAFACFACLSDNKECFGWKEDSELTCGPCRATNITCSNKFINDDARSDKENIVGMLSSKHRLSRSGNQDIQSGSIQPLNQRTQSIVNVESARLSKNTSPSEVSYAKQGSPRLEKRKSSTRESDGEHAPQKKQRKSTSTASTMQRTIHQISQRRSLHSAQAGKYVSQSPTMRGFSVARDKDASGISSDSATGSSAFGCKQLTKPLMSSNIAVRNPILSAGERSYQHDPALFIQPPSDTLSSGAVILATTPAHSPTSGSSVNQQRVNDIQLTRGSPMLRTSSTRRLQSPSVSPKTILSQKTDLPPNMNATDSRTYSGASANVQSYTSDPSPILGGEQALMLREQTLSRNTISLSGPKQVPTLSESFRSDRSPTLPVCYPRNSKLLESDIGAFTTQVRPSLSALGAVASSKRSRSVMESEDLPSNVNSPEVMGPPAKIARQIPCINTMTTPVSTTFAHRSTDHTGNNTTYPQQGTQAAMQQMRQSGVSVQRPRAVQGDQALNRLPYPPQLPSQVHPSQSQAPTMTPPMIAQQAGVARISESSNPQIAIAARNIASRELHRDERRRQALQSTMMKCLNEWTPKGDANQTMPPRARTNDSAATSHDLQTILRHTDINRASSTPMTDPRLRVQDQMRSRSRQSNVPQQQQQASRGMVASAQYIPQLAAASQTGRFPQQGIRQPQNVAYAHRDSWNHPGTRSTGAHQPSLARSGMSVPINYDGAYSPYTAQNMGFQMNHSQHQNANNVASGHEPFTNLSGPTYRYNLPGVKTTNLQQLGEIYDPHAAYPGRMQQQQGMPATSPPQSTPNHRMFPTQVSNVPASNAPAVWNWGQQLAGDLPGMHQSSQTFASIDGGQIQQLPTIDWEGYLNLHTEDTFTGSRM